jgi:hypothetical protein
MTGAAAAALAITATSRRTSETHCPIFHEVVRFFDAPATAVLQLLALTGPKALGRRTPRVVDVPAEGGEGE